MSAYLAASFKPMPHLWGHRLYVVEFIDGSIKVGRSRQVDERIRTYAEINQAWVSDLVSTPAITEGVMIAAVAAEATDRRGSEYFSGVTFDRAVEIASDTVAAESDGTGTIDQIIGKRVQAAMTEARMSMGQVASISGLSRVSLQRKIHGRRAWTIGELGAVAKALGVPAISLVAFEAAA